MAQVNQAPSPSSSSHTATTDHQNLQVMFSTGTIDSTTTFSSAMRLEIQALRARCSRLQTERDRFKDALWNLRAEFSTLQTHAEGLELENAELREGMSPMSTEGWRFGHAIALEPSNRSMPMQEATPASISNVGSQFLTLSSVAPSTSSVDYIPTITTQESPNVPLVGVAPESQQQPDHNLQHAHALPDGRSGSPLAGPSTASYVENSTRVSFVEPLREIEISGGDVGDTAGVDGPPPIYRIGPPRSKSKNKKGKRKETEGKQKDVESSTASHSGEFSSTGTTRSKRSRRDDSEHDRSTTHTSVISSSSGHKRIRMDDASSASPTMKTKATAMPKDLRSMISLPEDASSDLRAKFDSLMQPQPSPHRFRELIPPPPPPAETEPAIKGQLEGAVSEPQQGIRTSPSPAESLALEPAQRTTEGGEDAPSGAPAPQLQKAKPRNPSPLSPPKQQPHSHSQPQTKTEFESISAPLPRRSSSRRASAAPSVVSTRSTRSRSSMGSGDTRGQRVKTHWDPSTGRRIQIGGGTSTGRGGQKEGAGGSAEKKRLVISIRPKGSRGVRK